MVIRGQFPVLLCAHRPELSILTRRGNNLCWRMTRSSSKSHALLYADSMASPSAALPSA